MQSHRIRYFFKRFCGENCTFWARLMEDRFGRVDISEVVYQAYFWITGGGRLGGFKLAILRFLLNFEEKILITCSVKSEIRTLPIHVCVPVSHMDEGPARDLLGERWLAVLCDRTLDCLANGLRRRCCCCCCCCCCPSD